MELGKVIITRGVLVAGLMLGALLTACSTMTKAEREAKRAARAQEVCEALDSRHYKIEVNTMHPRRMGTRQVTSDWSLEVKEDTLISYLPYVGVAYGGLLGNTQGLNFTAPIKGYEDSGFVKGERTILLRVRNDEDIIEYRVEVMDNGSAWIHVTPQKRESIGFSGEMRNEKNEE